MLSLSPMSQDEFEEFRKFSVENYAKAIFRNLRLTYRQSLMLANEESEEVLPFGYYSEGHYFYNLTARPDNQKIGYLWYYINHKRQSAFLYDFYILPSYRSKGYGKIALSKMEQQLAIKNINVVRLNVFADNTKARELYTNQGFSQCNEILQKFI